MMGLFTYILLHEIFSRLFGEDAAPFIVLWLALAVFLISL